MEINSPAIVNIDELINKKAAVILSGCGTNDGSEIFETVACIQSLLEQGFKVEYFAVNKDFKAYNHKTNEETSEVRNSLIEASRFCSPKKEVRDIKEMDVTKYHTVIFPGGYGVVKHLSTVIKDGINAHVNEEIEKILIIAIENKIPLGFICAASILPSLVFTKCTITFGKNTSEVATLAMIKGSTLVNCHPNEYCYDENLGILTTPAFLNSTNILSVRDGIGNMINKIDEIVLYNMSSKNN